MEKIFICPREKDQTTSEIRKNRLISLEAQHGFLPPNYHNFLLGIAKLIVAGSKSAISLVQADISAM